ncbi:hypothetical protein EJB05_49304, partial [Eragrostis curvula]
MSAYFGSASLRHPTNEAPRASLPISSARAELLPRRVSSPCPHQAGGSLELVVPASEQQHVARAGGAILLAERTAGPSALHRRPLHLLHPPLLRQLCLRRATSTPSPRAKALQKRLRAISESEDPLSFFRDSQFPGNGSAAAGIKEFRQDATCGSIHPTMATGLGFLKAVALVLLAAALYSPEGFSRRRCRWGTRTGPWCPRRSTRRALAASERVGEGRLPGPEDMAYAAASGLLYTGCADGCTRRREWLPKLEAAADDPIFGLPLEIDSFGSNPFSCRTTPFTCFVSDLEWDATAI